MKKYLVFLLLMVGVLCTLTTPAFASVPVSPYGHAFPDNSNYYYFEYKGTDGKWNYQYFDKSNIEKVYLDTTMASGYQISFKMLTKGSTSLLKTFRYADSSSSSAPVRYPSTDFTTYSDGDSDYIINPIAFNNPAWTVAGTAKTNFDLYDQNGNLAFTDSRSADEIYNDISSYKFTGIKFYKPQVNSLINDNLIEIIIKGNVSAPNLVWGASGPEIADKKSQIIDYLVKNMKFNVDGQISSLAINSHSVSDFQIKPNDSYQFTLKAFIGVQSVSLPHTFKVTGKFITGYTGALWWQDETTVTYDDTVSFNVNFVDFDQDGIDDNTGAGGGSSSVTENDGLSKPNKGDYDDDILGNIKYGFDTLMYWITSPFRMIADGLNSVIDYLSNSMSWIATFTDFISDIFGFLPTEIVGLIYTGFTVSILYGIIRLIRGT